MLFTALYWISLYVPHTCLDIARYPPPLHAYGINLTTLSIVDAPTPYEQHVLPRFQHDSVVIGDYVHHVLGGYARGFLDDTQRLNGLVQRCRLREPYTCTFPLQRVSSWRALELHSRYGEGFRAFHVPGTTDDIMIVGGNEQA